MDASVALGLTLLYVTLIFLSVADTVPDLTDYRIQLIVGILALIATLPALLLTRVVRPGRQAALMAGLTGWVLVSSVPHGWFGGILVPLQQFTPLAAVFFLTAFNVRSVKQLKILRLCLLAVTFYLLGRGLYYGAGASEAPLCDGENVYVVGGGNSAGQAVMHLAKHARSVTMLVRDKALAASMSQYLSDRILGAANVQVRYDVEVTGLDGGQALERIRIGSRTTKEANWAATPRLFVAIGGVPNTDWAADTAIVRDPGGYLVTGPDLLTNGKAPASWPLERAPYYLETAVPGSFAAGDVRHRSIKRVATAAGEGAMAIAFVHRYLEETV